jgi:hypothetical protein
VNAGALDWRFADPQADVLMGFNVGSIAASPLARTLVAQLGARQNLNDADIKKLFDGLAAFDQIAVSVQESQMVAMLTGSVNDATLPPAQPGMKAYPISAKAMLFGSTEAVDQAAQRITAKAALSELALAAAERQASSEFWAIGSARAFGQQAIDAGVKRFSLTVSVRNRLDSDVAFELNGPPNAKTVEMTAKSPGTIVEGNMIYTRTTIEANEVQQKFSEIAAGLVGERLGLVVEAARHLPARDLNLLKQTRPVIYGLDDGPKVVSQKP